MEGTETGEGKKSHSVKVPRLYKEAAKALKQVEENGEGLKNAIHALKHPNVKAITALVSEALRHSLLLGTLLSKSKILENEKALSQQVPLTKILITELIWGKKRLGGESKPVTTISSYQGKFDKILNKLERRQKTKESEGQVIPEIPGVAVKKPRYVRVNVLKMEFSNVISILTEDGWIQRENIEYCNLTENDFVVDDFVNNLLVFAHGTEFYKHPFYLNGIFILQDKASCLPPLALKARLGRVILDACAAPGMKTSLLSALTNNEGSIIAVEKNSARCETLRNMLQGLGVNNVTVLNQDFTDITPQDHPEVEYIMVDPSCSGSGMYNRVEMHFGPGGDNNSKGRLKALAFYQRKLLVHAMKFPNVKRIVYSTCSVNAEENEDVIAAALEWGDGFAQSENPEELQSVIINEKDQSHLKFRVKEALPEWSHRSENSNYEWANLCVRSDFENNFTDGFFVAVLERVKEKSKKIKHETNFYE